MAAALAKFRCLIFQDPVALQKFVSTDSTIATVTAIVCDSSGKYLLFYMIA